MTMLKRILFATLIITSIALITGVWIYFRGTVITGGDPIRAVAPDAAVVIRTSDFSSFADALEKGSDMWAALEKATGNKWILTGVRYLDSLTGANPNAGELARNRKLLLSMHPSGRDRYQPVFYTSISGMREVSELKELAGSLLEGRAMTGERLYNRVRIYDVTMHGDRGPGNFSWAVTEGIFILSFSPVLLENAIDQVAVGDNIFDDDYFMKVYSTTGRNVAANIFVNLRNLPRYISSWTSGEIRNSLLLGGVLGDWAELDLHLRADGMLMNGFSRACREGDSYLDLFDGQSPVTTGALQVIPGNASAFLALGMSDVHLFHENMRRWNGDNGRQERLRRLEEEFRTTAGTGFFPLFQSFMEGEVVLVMTGWEEPGTEGESFLMVRTRSSSLAGEALGRVLDHHAGQQGRRREAYREVYRVDSETSFDIFRFPFTQTGELLSGRAFGTAQTLWYTFVGNYLVFGESVKGLSEFIHANVLNQTLSADRRFRDFSEYLMLQSNMWFYTDLPRSAGLLTWLLREDVAGNIAEDPGPVRKFQALSAQFSADNDMLYNNLSLRYSPVVTEEPRTEWQTLLDTVIDFKPHLLVNHNTGENEIFVQDEKNNIYLINRAGRILWKRPLPGRILGDVYQIDLYKNNRLQMLFNTREQIFMVDRNGNDVGRYPVRLPSPATNGISVFDYEDSRDYRIFVACEDRTVVVRSGDGNIVPGWNFGRTEHNVYHEIQHIRSGGRDYIVFADRHRVYILDRRGNVRLRPDKVFPVSGQNNIVFEGRTPASAPRITITDTLGLVWHIGLDGTTEVVKLGEYSSGHFFDFQDVNANGLKDYIFVDRNRLEVFGNNGLLIFSHEFPSEIIHVPAYYHFSARDRKIGVVSQDEGRIYLFNSGGELYTGFPLSGRSCFTVGFFRPGQTDFNLIVGSDDNFLYNYNVY